MTPRRQETGYPSAQPVRFYKIVALSFLAITLVLLGVIMFMSSKRAIITISTRTEPIEVTTAVGVNSADGLRVDGTIVTTTVSLVQHFEPTGTRTELGVATGIVTLHNESFTSQALVATTRLLTTDGVLFRMKDRALVPANGTIDVEVYADKLGVSGNIAPARFTIPGLRVDRQQEIFATSESAMSGGERHIGVLSEDDIAQAKKVIHAQLEEKGTLELTKRFPEKSGVFRVVDERIIVEGTVGEEVASFTLTGSGVIIGVFYNPVDVKKVSEELLQKRVIDDSEIIRPGDTEPTVHFSEYLPDGTAFLDVRHTGMVMMNPESKQLDKLMFYGKTRDEIRRYVLGLDHVNGVDVSFKPLWNRTAPYVSDHLTIIVKEVE